MTGPRPWRVWLVPDQYELVGPDGYAAMDETRVRMRRVRMRAFMDEDDARRTADRLASRFECGAIVEYKPTGERTEVMRLPFGET